MCSNLPRARKPRRLLARRAASRAALRTMVCDALTCQSHLTKSRRELTGDLPREPLSRISIEHTPSGDDVFLTRWSVWLVPHSSISRSDAGPTTGVCWRERGGQAVARRRTQETL
jgi:hypothetical protein